MSVISNIHSFTPFVSGVSAPADESQRLAKIIFKQTADMTAKGKKAPESICVSVPSFEGAELSEQELQALVPHIFNLLETAQDGIIRRKYLAGASSVHDDSITVAACIAFLNEEEASKRLSKEKIAGWCENSGLADILRLRFAEVLGISDEPTAEESEKVEAGVAGYVEKYASLSGSKTFYTPEVATKLLKALELGSIQDDMATLLEGKLTEMIQNPKKGLELLSL